MTGMKLIGVRRRVVHARASLNRLQHEVEFAIQKRDDEPIYIRELNANLSDILECIAILTNIAEKVAPVVEDSGRAEQLRTIAEFYKDYHKVPR